MALTIEQLNNKIDSEIADLQVKIDTQAKEIATLKNKPLESVKLDRYLDNQSKDIIRDIIDDQVFTSMWDEYYYYSSTFEAITRYTIVSFGTEVWEVGTSGLHLGTDPNTNSEVSAILDLISTSTLSINKETKFRCSTKVDSITAVNYIISTLTDASAQNGIGFRLISGTIYGVTDRSGSETTLSLGSYSANTIVTLEYRYYPGSKIIFYVNGIEKGAITSSTYLPLETALTRNLIDVGLATTENVAKNSYTQYFEIIQRK